MIPTDEEKAKILEAQLANPDIPLGTAEQFLLTLSSISELQARLNVWLFKLDYETVESVSSFFWIVSCKGPAWVVQQCACRTHDLVVVSLIPC